MDAPQIQYAKTIDGVNIAYTDTGEGPPLVVLPAYGMSHAQRVWALFPNFFPALVRSFRLINYDHRGGGLSDRDAIEFSMDACTRDFDTIVESTSLHGHGFWQGRGR